MCIQGWVDGNMSDCLIKTQDFFTGDFQHQIRRASLFMCNYEAKLLYPFEEKAIPRDPVTSTATYRTVCHRLPQSVVRVQEIAVIILYGTVNVCVTTVCIDKQMCPRFIVNIPFDRRRLRA